MRRALVLALVLQLGSGLFWTLSVAASPGRGDFALLGLLVVVYAVQIPAAVFGIWALWRREELRRLAAIVVSAPVVFWFLPGIIKTLAGGHLTANDIALLGVAIATLVVVISLVLPKKVAVLLPPFLFRSRLINSLVLAGLIIGWLVPIGVVAYVVAGGNGSSGGDTGEGLAMAIVLAATYLIALGAGSICAAAWGWLGLRSGVEGACRRLNIAQIVAAFPAGIAGAAAVAFMVSQN